MANYLSKTYRDYLHEKKNRPWLLVFYTSKTKCTNPKCHYFKMGIKFELTKEQMRELWFKYNADNMKKPSIDRIDTTGDYTLDNTRFIELSINLKRRKKPVFNKTGLAGVSLRCDGKAYTSQICIKGKIISLGSFKTAIEANKVYIDKSRLLEKELMCLL